MRIKRGRLLLAERDVGFHLASSIWYVLRRTMNRSAEQRTRQTHLHEEDRDRSTLSFVLSLRSRFDFTHQSRVYANRLRTAIAAYANPTVSNWPIDLYPQSFAVRFGHGHFDFFMKGIVNWGLVKTMRLMYRLYFYLREQPDPSRLSNIFYERCEKSFPPCPLIAMNGSRAFPPAVPFYSWPRRSLSIIGFTSCHVALVFVESPHRVLHTKAIFPLGGKWPILSHE